MELKNKATLNIKIQQSLSSLSFNDYRIYLRDGPFSSDIGIVNLHPTNGTNGVCYIDEHFFDFYGFSPPPKQSNFIIKRNGHCVHSEYKIQGLTSKRDSFCASYCSYILYLTKVNGLDFRSAVLNLCYQKFS